MSEYEDVFKAIEEHGPIDPQLRIYLLSQKRLPFADLSMVLPEYDVVLPRSSNEIAFMRKSGFESEELFRLECVRAAAIMASLLGADSYISCLSDNARGYTQFGTQLQKIGESSEFIETNPEL
jgi:hypothetical protein